MDKITNKDMDDAVNQLFDDALKPLCPECSIQEYNFAVGMAVFFALCVLVDIRGQI